MPSRPIDSTLSNSAFVMPRPLSSMVERQYPAAYAHADAYRPCVRVTDDVGQRFLKDAEQRKLPCAIGQTILESPRDATADTCSRLKFRRFPLHRFLQSKVIEHRRPQITRNLANRLDAYFNQSNQRLKLVDELYTWLGFAFAQLIDEPHELQLEARQHLAQLVVELTRDSRAFFLTSHLEAQRKRVQTLLRRLIGFVGRDARPLARARFMCRTLISLFNKDAMTG